MFSTDNLTHLKQLFFVVFLTVTSSSLSLAAPAIFEVGEAVLPATSNNTFTRVNFATPFAAGSTPNVFPMTTEDGDDPCTIRIRNVDGFGFDAVCLEPQDADGTHPGMMLEYIAVADGNVDIPLAGALGNVTFRSECVDTNDQVFGPNCDNCSGTNNAFQSIQFTPAFNAAPALLTQIQTTNNLQAPGGDPIFIDTAVTTVATNGFQLSIDQLEAGTAPIAVDEEVCYLAVERAGCQSLDFSSFGGPQTPVAFNALHGNNVDGHDNGCTNGEGANFANGCFASVPIAIAGFRSRNGNNGSVLRRCSLNAGAILLTADEDQVSDNERNHIDELVSVLAFSEIFTTPVTLNQASIARFGRKALFEWQTSAESFHLGFNLWGEFDGEWQQLNRKLIRSEQTDYAGIRDYQMAVRLNPEQKDRVTQFGISTVDNSGYEEFYGPFSAGESYGEIALNQAIDWTSTRAAMEQRLAANGYTKFKGRWRQTNKRLQKRAEKKQLGLDQAVINLTPTAYGINRVSAALLLDQLPSWQGKPLNEVALMLNGRGIPRYIESIDDRLDSDDVIYFAAMAPEGADAVYFYHYNYQIRLDHDFAIDSNTFNAQLGGQSNLDDSPTLGVFSQTLTTIKAHSAILDNGDPWFDSELFTTGNPVSKAYEFNISNETSLTENANLDITLFGSIDFPDPEPDHHVQVRINGKLVRDIWFDGAVAKEISISVPAELLVLGENSLTLSLPGDTGYTADVVLIDTIEIELMRSLENSPNYEFKAQGENQVLQASFITGQSRIPIVFAYTDKGALSHLQNGQFNDNGFFELLGLPTNENVTYLISQTSSIDEVSEVSISQPSKSHELEADLLIVSHPLFISPDLQAYAEFKAEIGLSVSIVNWLDIVDSYGYGNPSPSALNSFLSKANDHSPVTNVLLVGGHTYDYLGVSGQEVVNYIPTHYRQIGLFGHAPSDNAFADLNGDNKPELAIGRWPVRTAKDLQHVIAKSMRWNEARSVEQYQDALLIAQAVDGRGLNFEDQIVGRVGLPLSKLEFIAKTELVSMQKLIDEGVEKPIQEARSLITEQINSGTDIISFAGHASSAAWGFQSIVNTQFIQSLENEMSPLIVMPLACYTTNYESPSINTLAHQWLFAGRQGAAAIHGASVLGEHRENAIFTERFLQANLSTGSLGQAILKAKQQMASQNSMLHNWTLLGDPTLPLR